MGIDAQLRDEQGNVLAEVGDKNFVLSRAVSTGAFAGTNLLRYLVPWGDTIFNQAQAGDLLIDVKIVVSQNKNEQIAEYMRKLQAMIDRLSNEMHCYLWFVGD